MDGIEVLGGHKDPRLGGGGAALDSADVEEDGDAVGRESVRRWAVLGPSVCAFCHTFRCFGLAVWMAAECVDDDGHAFSPFASSNFSCPILSNFSSFSHFLLF